MLATRLSSSSSSSSHAPNHCSDENKSPTKKTFSPPLIMIIFYIILARHLRLLFPFLPALRFFSSASRRTPPSRFIFCVSKHNHLINERKTHTQRKLLLSSHSFEKFFFLLPFAPFHKVLSAFLCVFAPFLPHSHGGFFVEFLSADNANVASRN